MRRYGQQHSGGVQRPQENAVQRVKADRANCPESRRGSLSRHRSEPRTLSSGLRNRQLCSRATKKEVFVVLVLQPCSQGKKKLHQASALSPPPSPVEKNNIPLDSIGMHRSDSKTQNANKEGNQVSRQSHEEPFARGQQRCSKRAGRKALSIRIKNADWQQWRGLSHTKEEG